MADDDLTEVGAALKMPIRVRRRFELEYPINYRPQAMHAIALFIASKSARLPTLIDRSVMPRPPSALT